MPTTVERKVYFYRAVPATDEDGNPLPFDPRRSLLRVSQIGFNNGARYLRSGDDHDICVWPQLSPRRIALQLGTVRRASLPEVEDGGNVRPLNLRANQGIVEQTHAIFFPDNIVGVEFNFYGPRISRLSQYLVQKIEGHPRVNFVPLLKPDIAQELQNLQDVRILHLRLHRDYLDLLRTAEESLPAALRATAASIDSPVVELLLRQTPRSRRSLGQRALDFVRDIAGQPQTRESADLFRVRGLDGRTGKIEWFDLLKDQLVSTRTVVRQVDRHRKIDSDSMFTEITAAHNELRPQLADALGLQQ